MWGQVFFGNLIKHLPVQHWKLILFNRSKSGISHAIMSILQYFVQFAFALPIFFVLLDNIRKYNVTNIALKEIPGPFFAKFTNLWRFVISLRGQGTTIQRKLHNKHGPVVRLGPTYVSLSDPAVISQIYSTKGDFIKVCKIWYICNCCNECVLRTQQRVPGTA